MAIIATCKKVFLRELSLYFMYCFCAVILSIYIGALYMDIILYIYFKEEKVSHRNDVLTVVMVITIVFIVINQKLHFQYRNFIIKGVSENPLIVYLMCLPLLILSFVGLLFLFIFLSLGPQKRIVPYIAGIIAVYGGTIILLININGTTDTGENWALNCSNFITVASCLITIVSLSYFNVSLNYVCFFKIVSQEYFNLSFPNNDNVSTVTEGLLNNTVQNLMAYFRSCLILLSLSICPYFIEPLRNNILALENHLKFVPDPIQHNAGQKTDKMINDYDVFFNTTIAALLLVPLFISHKNGLIFEVVFTVQFSLMIIACIYALADVRFWSLSPRRPDIDVFKELMLWIGMVGNFLPIVCDLFVYINENHQQDQVPLDAARMLRRCLECLGVFSQSVLMAFIIRRKFKEPKFAIRRMCRFVSPIFCLVVLNLSSVLSFFISTFKISEERHDYWNAHYISGIGTFGIPLSLSYRVFSILVLIKTVL